MSSPSSADETAVMAFEPEGDGKETDSRLYDSLAPSTVPTITDGKHVVVLLPSPRLTGFTHSLLKFGSPVRTAYGGYRVEVTYAGQPLQFQTPVMCAQFGLSTFQNKTGTSKSIELSFYHRRTMEPVQKFFNICRKLDSVTLNTCIERRDKWLSGVRRSHYANSEIWKKYSAITRTRVSKASGQEYDPRLSMKVWEGQSVLFGELEPGETFEGGEQTLEITDETFPDRTWSKSQLECTGLWLSKDSISYGFRLLQARIVAAPDGEGAPGPPGLKKPSFL